jgi:hypothetical protein
MNIRKELFKARDDIRLAMQIADEMKETNRAYRTTLQSIFDDELVPLEIRQQYERLLVQQLISGGVF